MKALMIAFFALAVATGAGAAMAGNQDACTRKQLHGLWGLPLRLRMGRSLKLAKVQEGIRSFASDPHAVW